MNSTTESPSTSAHLSSVKELLAALDKMKSKGIGARDRLDFILEQGSELVDDFDFNDAFDLELRAQTKRMRQLSELETVMRSARAQWEGGPFRENVKEAVGHLLDHLDKFRTDARHRETRVETEMLGSIWDWAPDIRWLYPWLTAWSGPIYRPDRDYGAARYSSYPVAPEGPVLEEPSKEVKELLELKDELYKEVKKKPEELETDEDQLEKLHNVELERLEKIHNAKLETVKEQTPEAEPAPPRRFPIRRDDEPERARVVAKFEASPPELETDHIRRDAWMTALREATLEDWRFCSERPGSPTTVLLWRAGKAEARLELIERPEGMHVWLRMIDAEGHFKSHSHTMPFAEVQELHLDPSDFVKKALED